MATGSVVSVFSEWPIDEVWAEKFLRGHIDLSVLGSDAFVPGCMVLKINDFELDRGAVERIITSILVTKDDTNEKSQVTAMSLIAALASSVVERALAGSEVTTPSPTGHPGSGPKT